MSKVITDENQLNTEVDDLITEDYALEVLGLKNPADFRKFSRSFMKLSKIVKEIDDNNNNKLDKGGYSGTAKNLNDELSKKATKTQLGRIIVGDNLTVDNNGKLNGTPPVDITGKLDKGSVPEKYNTAEKIANELDKKASKTELGRVKIGQNLSITEDGVLNGNPVYTHPTGNGYSHLPINGATGQFIKYASAGNGQWSQITWNDITGKPSTFPPSAHTQDWSTITGKPSSFTPSSHKHTKAEITDFPSSLKNPSALTIQANGTSLGSYDGSTAKTFNITASNVGASPSNHNHDNTYAKLNHGSHVPATLAANNKKFLRCDNTWVDVTPANIGAEPTIGTKQNAFNKPFGTAVNTILEGAKLAETLGIPYGGGLNNSNTKTAGYAYYDSTTKKTYKCTVTNTLNYADASKFEAISNADLLAKFQNLWNCNKSSNKYILKLGVIKIQWIIQVTAGTHNFLEAYTENFSAVAVGTEAGNNENTGCYHDGLTGVRVSTIQSGRKIDIIAIGI